MPRAAAARATATSPSGWTACTPVGEMSTGSDSCQPHHRRRQVPLRRDARDVGGEAQLAERLDVVAQCQPALGAGPDRLEDARRKPPFGPPLGLGDGSRTTRRPSAEHLQAGDGILIARPAWALSASGRWRAAGIRRTVCVSRASPCPSTHSGSGPSSGSPVKNLAAMQPPRQASNRPHDAQAPPVWGERSSANSAESRHTPVKPPGSRTLPARNASWMANGQA